METLFWVLCVEECAQLGVQTANTYIHPMTRCFPFELKIPAAFQSHAAAKEQMLVVWEK